MLVTTPRFYYELNKTWVLIYIWYIRVNYHELVSYTKSAHLRGLCHTNSWGFLRCWVMVPAALPRVHLLRWHYSQQLPSTFFSQQKSKSTTHHKKSNTISPSVNCITPDSKVKELRKEYEYIVSDLYNFLFSSGSISL